MSFRQVVEELWISGRVVVVTERGYYIKQSTWGDNVDNDSGRLRPLLNGQADDKQHRLSKGGDPGVLQGK